MRRGPSARFGLAGIAALAALAIAAPDSEAAGSARFFAAGAVTQVSVSPSGEWVVGVAQHAGQWGILVQRRGEAITVPIYGSTQGIEGVEWIGADSLFVRHPQRDAVKAVVLRFRIEGDFLVHDELEIRQFGELVHPLKDEEEIVLWSQHRVDRVVVLRGPISALAFGRAWKASGRWIEGEVEIVAEQRKRVTAWLADRDGVVRAALIVEDGDDPELALLYRAAQDESWREVWEGDAEEAPVPIGITSDDRRLMVVAYGDHDTRGLHELDPESGALVREIFRRPGIDVTGALLDYNQADVLAVTYLEAGAVRFDYLDDFKERHLPGVGTLGLSDSVAVTSSSRDHRFFTLFAFGARDPGTFYFYEKESGKLTKLGDVNSQVQREGLTPMEAFEVQSSDGTRLEAYLARPERRDGKLPPLLVLPHGGPIGVRDARSFDPLLQYVADAGIAVLKVNYRGSEGYGRAFLKAGAREWGRGIEDDIDAAVRHVLDAGLVDSERICIGGGSYGGYSALMSAIRWPERYRCVVTVNGVSDLPLHVSNLPYIRPLQRWARENVGDLDRDFDSLVQVSPVYRVEDLRAPVMIIQGSEDEIVDPDHAYRLRAMMEAHGKVFEWLEIPNMGHSPNVEQWHVVAEALRWFVECHLDETSVERRIAWRGRRCEPTAPKQARLP